MSRDTGTFEFRRKSQRVFVDRPTGDVILRLHETDIVRVTPRGDVILSTGGWATRKTLSSMNDALELFGMWVESLVRSETQGQWQVTDSDGSVHPYINNRQNFMTTIRAKSADDRQRAEWLAEAYEIPYTPRAAPPPAAAAAAAAPSGPRVAAAPTASTAAPPAQYNGGGVAAAAAAATAVRPAGIGGSWANVAKTSSNPGHVHAGVFACLAAVLQAERVCCQSHRGKRTVDRTSVAAFMSRVWGLPAALPVLGLDT
jgi:pyruvate/2-oxoglutarate dehydrogenase complex dihydrolipoamide acyltransferase (E2) component